MTFAPECCWSLEARATFLGDFGKTSLGLPFALFLKMQVLGDLPKIAITSPFGPYLSRCVRLNLVKSLHFKCMLI